MAKVKTRELALYSLRNLKDIYCKSVKVYSDGLRAEDFYKRYTGQTSDINEEDFKSFLYINRLTEDVILEKGKTYKLPRSLYTYGTTKKEYRVVINGSKRRLALTKEQLESLKKGLKENKVTKGNIEFDGTKYNVFSGMDRWWHLIKNTKNLFKGGFTPIKAIKSNKNVEVCLKAQIYMYSVLKTYGASKNERSIEAENIFENIKNIVDECGISEQYLSNIINSISDIPNKKDLNDLKSNIFKSSNINVQNSGNGTSPNEDDDDYDDEDEYDEVFLNNRGRNSTDNMEYAFERAKNAKYEYCLTKMGFTDETIERIRKARDHAEIDKIVYDTMRNLDNISRHIGQDMENDEQAQQEIAERTEAFKLANEMSLAGEAMIENSTSYEAQEKAVDEIYNIMNKFGLDPEAVYAALSQKKEQQLAKK